MIWKKNLLMLLLFFVGMEQSVFGIDNKLPCRSDSQTHTCKLQGQTIDPREYVDWGDGKCFAPYDKYVKMDSGGVCTAQYVASDFILTAAHCVLNDNTHKLRQSRFRFVNCKGEYFYAKPIKIGNLNKYYNSTGTWSDKSVPYDWVILRVEDAKFFYKNTFSVPNEKMILDVASQQRYYLVDNAGFGALPILSDEQLRYIKYETQRVCPQLTANGAMFLCFQRVWNEFPWATIDVHNLKVNKECRLWPYFHGSIKESDGRIYKYNGDFHFSRCYTWGGNSGGAYSYSGSDTLLGIVSGGKRSAPGKNKHGFVVPTRTINMAVKSLRPKNNIIYINNLRSLSQILKKDAGVISFEANHTRKNFNELMDDNLDEVSQDVSDADIGTEDENTNDSDLIAGQMGELQSFIEHGLQQLDSLSDEQLLDMAGQMSEYSQLKEQYEKAKAREQSIPNKILGALSIGATGIGGMQLMSGLAEQRADDAAERDMQAYLATFRCDYGAGRNIVGGQTNIELPGANVMTESVNEYKQMALQLQQLKSELGISPGIESELVLDESEMNIYDNVSVGTQLGAFTSLSRALSDKNSADATAWAEQKAGADKKVKNGTIVGGAGAAGGAVGNLIINRPEKQSETQSKKE